MKKRILSILLLVISNSFCEAATVTVYGKNNGSTVTTTTTINADGSKTITTSITINCDNWVQDKCYSVNTISGEVINGNHVNVEIEGGESYYGVLANWDMIENRIDII